MILFHKYSLLQAVLLHFRIENCFTYFMNDLQDIFFVFTQSLRISPCIDDRYNAYNLYIQLFIDNTITVQKINFFSNPRVVHDIDIHKNFRS